MTVVTVEVEITLNTVEDVRKRILAAVEAGKYAVAVDLSQVEIITTPGLGMLLQVNRVANELDCQMVLVSPRLMVRDTLLRTQLNRVLRVVETLGDAKKLVEPNQD